jgi:acyl-CoA reductase-like NAD-dependent aldehyde dehydrogenase
MKFISVNPYSEETLARYELIGSEALETAIQKADNAQRNWKKIPLAQRVTYFSKLASLIKEKHEELAVLATIEMGKTVSEAKAEVLKCARGCEYYAAHAEHWLEPEVSQAETGKTVYVSHEPLGVVLGIFPWNFPYWQILRSAVPTVIAGNAMLVKPAPNVPQCSLAIQQLIDECGLPKGLIQVIFADEEQIQQVIADKRVKAVTLTGSDKAGSIVASGAAKQIKKSVLELGGSDPFIVLDDADLDKTLEQAITARFQNNGQSCIAAKRFILQAGIADEFLDRLTQKVASLKCGDPLKEGINIGPLARKDLRDKLAAQVSDSVSAGAAVHFQQETGNLRGYFYPPTILANITKDCPAYYEELFGPVISIYTVSTEEEAIAIANATDFGLGASIWSRSEERALAMAGEIESGQVFINEMVKSQPSHPFGGVKRSGYGRELGKYGLYEFCNVKAVWR